MEDLRRELASLRRRMRLQTLAGIGALVVLCTAMGGAEVVANNAVTLFAETDGWKIQSTNTAGSLQLDRLTCTAGADVARIRVQSANIELAAQTTDPFTLNSNIAPGALWYNSTTGRVQLRHASAWSDVSPILREHLIYAHTSTAIAWTNMPAGPLEFLNLVSSRKKIDLTGCTQFRILVHQVAAGAVAAKLRLEYSTNQSTWTALEASGTGADLVIGTATNQLKVGAFGTIATAARADMFIRVVGLTGDAIADPSFRMVAYQVR